MQLSEEQARVAALVAQLAALGGQSSAEQQAQFETRQAGPVALDESRAKLAEAEAASRGAADEAGRREKLFASGLVAEAELVRAQAESQKRQAAADALRIAINRQNKDQRARDSGQQAALENLKRDTAALDGEINTRQTIIAKLGASLSSLLSAAIAWQQVSPLLKAAARSEKAGSIIHEAAGELRETGAVVEAHRASPNQVVARGWTGRSNLGCLGLANTRGVGVAVP